MGPRSVHEYAASLRPHYRIASRREKGRLLTEFCRVIPMKECRNPKRKSRFE